MVVICGELRLIADRPIWISGNSTHSYSRDFLARSIALIVPEIGDLIAFHHAGAYCRSMVTRFLGNAAEIAINTTAHQVPLLSVAE